MRKKEGKIVKCLICKVEFYVKRVHLLKGWGKYCSTKCHGFSLKGIIPSNLAYAQSKSPIGKKGNSYHNKGEKHWAWQKENPSYRAVHAWMRKEFGIAIKCENKECIYPRKDGRGYLMLKPKVYQWANISRQYKRERSDFMQLCSSCHKNYDVAYAKAVA